MRLWSLKGPFDRFLFLLGFKPSYVAPTTTSIDYVYYRSYLGDV